MARIPILSILIWLPVLAAVLVSFFKNNSQIARVIALMVMIISLLLCVPLYTHFDINSAAMQFTEHLTWISVLKINYDLGVDGISQPLVILTCLTTLLIVLASWTMVHEKVNQYLATFLVMQGMMVGVFAAMDSLLFYFFWEATLIPMYMSIGIWGSQNRSYAAIKFFLYTFFGSTLLLIAILYLRLKADSFLITDFYQLKIALTTQIIIFIGFFLAFAIKVPMFPLHTWLPHAHTEAPAGGSVILAALMLKLGGYGFLRFTLPIVPDACRYLEWVMVALSLVAILYIGLIAIAQVDMKRLIAYSSVAHMGFVTLGCFFPFIVLQKGANVSFATLGIEGAVVQMIAHAFGSGALFLAFGALYEQMHTRQLKDFGGVANVMPIFAAFFMLFVMANVGLPGTSGFVGEFFVIMSTFQSGFWVTFFAATTLITGAAYSLWMYRRVFYGEVANDDVRQLKDIRGFDIWVFALLAVFILLIGVFPESLLRVVHATANHLIEIMNQSHLESSIK